MNALQVVRIDGDGIGPEIMDAVVRVLEAAGANISWVPAYAGEGALARFGSELPEDTIKTAKRVGLAIKGPTGTPSGADQKPGYRSANVRLRIGLGTYAGIRPAKLLPGVPSRFADCKVDFVIFRENTEGMYTGEERRIDDDTFEATKRVTTAASRRIALTAFSYARKHGLSEVVVASKSNIMQLTDGHFVRTCQAVAKDFPGIALRSLHVDYVGHQMVANPSQFQAIVTLNLYGDFLSEVAAAVQGGIGLAAGLNLGENVLLAEAVHGTWPDGAGKNLANPTALLRSAIMLMQHAGQDAIAQRMESALMKALQDGQRTRDLGGSLGTREFTDAVIARLA